MNNWQDGIFFIAYGIGVFAWAQLDFAGLVRLMGMFSRWAFVIPSTRIGMSAISLAIVLAGALQLMYHGTRTPLQNVLAIAMGLLAFGAFIHDLVSAASERKP
jgi:hypothetical protein